MANNTKKVNVRFLKQGLIKAEVPVELEGEELVDYCKENVLDVATDQQLINAMSDIGEDTTEEFGGFDADSFQVECIEDSETFDIIEQTPLWKLYGFEDEYIEMMESENKAMGDFLEQKLGFTHSGVSNIANGTQVLIAVHVVCFNKLEEYKLFTNENEAKAHYVSMCKKWYNSDAFENFKANCSESEISEYDMYEKYVDSEEYKDADSDARVSLEVK